MSNGRKWFCRIYFFKEFFLLWVMPARSSSSSLIFQLEFEKKIQTIIKNSACDCPSQLLYFHFYRTSRICLGLSLFTLFFFLFKSRSYQIFIFCLSHLSHIHNKEATRMIRERIKIMIMTLHCSLSAAQKSCGGKLPIHLRGIRKTIRRKWR